MKTIFCLPGSDHQQIRYSSFYHNHFTEFLCQKKYALIHIDTFWVAWATVKPEMWGGSLENSKDGPEFEFFCATASASINLLNFYTQ